MGAFFRFIISFVSENGWRRKLGLRTLVVACVFMVVWVRSLTTHDLIHSPEVLDQIHSFGSHAGAFYWIRSNRWQSETPPSPPTPDPHRHSLARQLGFADIEIRQNSGGTAMFVGKGVAIPYWTITIPLTLVSLWLLIPNPSKSYQNRAAEPNANAGT